MKKLSPIFILLSCMSILIVLRFPDFFTANNTQVIEPWGDGYKAYHAVFYHAQYDSTLTHFEGMNYPYGEHVVPGACQPLLSNSIKILAQLGIDLSPYSFSIFHFFLLLGLLLSALFLFLIFRRLALPSWYSIIVAIGLAFLAPQLDRMGAHYGLAHPELLPIILYLLLRWHEQANWRWSVWIGVVVWSYSLIHFYYFAILSFAIFGWIGMRWLLRKDWSKTLSYLGNGILMLGLPLLFFLYWMILNDPVTDRNSAPWGFFEYRSRLTGIFTHLDIPYWQWLNDHLVAIYHPNIEAQSYIGLIASVFIVVFLIKWGLKRFKKWPFSLSNEKETYLQYLLLSGIAILIFAHGVPFIINGFERFLKYTGPIQQFRSIGRFAWIFYYAANIAAFYYLYQFWQQKKKAQKNLANWKKAWLMLPLGLLLFESFQYSTAKNLELDEIEDLKTGYRFTDLDIDYSAFQAILPIPYFNIGSDNFWWPAKGWISQRPHTLSLQTGLPLTSAMLTRTSLSQTIRQLQLVTEPYRLPPILKDYPNHKPLLLFWDNKRVHEYGDRYLHLNKHAQLIYQKDWLRLYKLPLESFQKNLNDQINIVQQSLDTLMPLGDNWMASDSTANWYFDGYDDQKQDNAYRGAGEFKGNLGYWNRLVDTIWQSNYTGDITISFWQYINSDRSSWTIISWAEYDAKSGQELFRQTRNSRENIKVFDDKGWALVEFTLPKQKAHSRIELILTHEVIKDGLLQVDDLLIRPANVLIGKKTTNGLWWNNRYYPH